MAFINPLASTAIMLLSYAPNEADRREPIMVPTPDMMFEGAKGGGKTNLMLERLKGADDGRTYKAEATITIAPQHRQAFAEMLDGIKQSREAPTVKPRSKRGQRVRRWR